MLQNFSLTAEKMKRQQEFVLWANKAMLEIGMTQKELAKKIGCGYGYLNCILSFRGGVRGSKWNAAIKKAILEAQENCVNKAQKVFK